MADDLRSLLSTTAERCQRYLDSLGERRVSPRRESIASLAALDVPLQDDPIPAGAVIAELDTVVTPATMAMAGPRFFGFVIGGSLPVALAADWMTSTWDQNTGLFNSTPGTAYIEEVALRWLLDLFGLPPTCAGAFVTGTTVAHITALAAARHAVLAKVGWNVEGDGLFGAPPVTVVVSEEAHPTLLKALGVVGFGRSRVVRIPTDDQGRMRAGALPRIHGPTIVCTQVGNVNSGACDPIAEICARAHAGEGGDAWVHVDGAFGLWARVAPSRAHLVAGMEQADSWATDGHKWLNVPYDSGIAFVRDGEALRAAMAVTAEYLPSASERRNPSDHTPELSRRARGVAIWAALRSLGRSGVAELIERSCRQARQFAEALSAAGYSVLNDVALNQVVVSFGDAGETRRVIAGVQEDGTMWAGETVWRGRVAMRISVSCWSTRDEDVRASVEAIRRVVTARRVSR
jgi:glutamate/tyrosine decarboxylase-like PLP-dependent enzyme